LEETAKRIKAQEEERRLNELKQAEIAKKKAEEAAAAAAKNIELPIV